MELPVHFRLYFNSIQTFYGEEYSKNKYDELFYKQLADQSDHQSDRSTDRSEPETV